MGHVDSSEYLGMTVTAKRRLRDFFLHRFDKCAA